MNQVKNLEFSSLSDFLNSQEICLFLKIPHEKNKLNDYAESVLFKNKKLKFFEIFVFHQDVPKNEYEKYSLTLYNSGNLTGKKGVYFGYKVNDYYAKELFTELIKEDKENGLKLFNDFLVNGALADDVKEVTPQVHLQSIVIKKYLEENDVKYHNLNIDYDKLITLDENDLENQLSELKENLNDNIKDFPQYNDLDYLPMIVGEDYCIFDFSADKLYVIKEENNNIKFYSIKNDDLFDINSIHYDYLNEFVSDNGQKYYLLKNKISELDLFCEINDGVIVKSKKELFNFVSIQNFITKEMVKENKIIDVAYFDCSPKERHLKI